MQEGVQPIFHVKLLISFRKNCRVLGLYIKVRFGARKWIILILLNPKNSLSKVEERQTKRDHEMTWNDATISGNL